MPGSGRATGQRLIAFCKGFGRLLSASPDNEQLKEIDMNAFENSVTAVPTTQSSGWIVFTYISFATSLVMVLGGIVLMPIELWLRGYLAIGVLMVVQASITLSKTLRDAAESARLVNRVETARTEKILMGS
jgi:hypothetical protein